jgi:hypothetical protein
MLEEQRLGCVSRNKVVDATILTILRKMFSYSKQLLFRRIARDYNPVILTEQVLLQMQEVDSL